MSEINLTKEQLLKRFAEAQGISEEEAVNLIGGETADDVMTNIKKFTQEKIRESMPPMNRAQRRAWQKKQRRNKNRIKPAAETISDTAEKLDFDMYTEETAAAMKEQIQNARSVIISEEATQEAIMASILKSGRGE